MRYFKIKQSAWCYVCTGNKDKYKVRTKVQPYNKSDVKNTLGNKYIHTGCTREQKEKEKKKKQCRISPKVER